MVGQRQSDCYFQVYSVERAVYDTLGRVSRILVQWVVQFAVLIGSIFFDYYYSPNGQYDSESFPFLAVILSQCNMS